MHVNPYHAEFLEWNNQPYIFGTFRFHFWECQNGRLKLVSQQCRAWADFTDVQAGLALCCWQGLIAFGNWQDKG